MRSVGGLKEGLVVELSNQSNAMVLEVTGEPCVLPLHALLSVDITLLSFCTDVSRVA